MKFIWKAFLWVNGQKGEDLTQYLAVPIFIEERLNDQLDTGQITLENHPQQEAFQPKTKIRIERWTGGDVFDEDGNLMEVTQPQRTFDMIVEKDEVESYVGRDVSTHRIHLIEPSAIAQGMHIDNIALTHELQDVTLNYKTYKPVIGNVSVAGGSPSGQQVSSQAAQAWGWYNTYDPPMTLL
jgi:hypothetical protein